MHRARSFHYMGGPGGPGARPLSTFQPSEHSAFQRLGGPGAKLGGPPATSTPLRGARPEEGLKGGPRTRGARGGEGKLGRGRG